MQLSGSGALAWIQVSVWKGEMLQLDKMVQEISEAGELIQVPCQSSLHSKTLSQKEKDTNIKKDTRAKFGQPEPQLKKHRV